jgi:heme O synthase-like polyprenyltransferase
MGNPVLNIINWFLGIAAWVASLMTIYGGVRYFLARGNKEKETRAGKIFIYGLVVLLILGFIFVISLPTTPPIKP